MDKELKHQLNRLSNIVNELIVVEERVENLLDKVKVQRIKLNDCIYKIRKLEQSDMDND